MIRRSHVPHAAPHVALWWRTQPSGHPDCLEHTQPLLRHHIEGTSNKSCQPSAKLWGANSPAVRHCCWPRISVLNELAATAFARVGGGVLFADPPLLMRPDAHVGLLNRTTGAVDCMHFCLAGPPTLLARAIAHIVWLGDSM